MLMDAKGIIRRTEDILRNDYQIGLNEANSKQLHRALSDAVMYAIADDWRRSRRARESGRRAYYISAEYLTGRMIYNNLFNLGLLDDVKHLLALRGVDISIMEDIEDCALGNGGLGRLAACFLDSAATHDLPLDGYGLRYKFGLFKQDFTNGFQTEYADDWQRQGDPWSRRRDDKTIVVDFGDNRRVLAVPYDMPMVGYNTSCTGTLRLWQSEAIEEFDFGRSIRRNTPLPCAKRIMLRILPVCSIQMTAPMRAKSSASGSSTSSPLRPCRIYSAGINAVTGKSVILPIRPAYS